MSTDNSLLQLRKKRGVKPTVTKAMAVEFKRLHDLGYSMESIGAQHKLTHACVSLNLKKLREGKFEGE